MAILSLSDIKSKVDELAKKIEISESSYPIFGKSRGDGKPFIVSDSTGYSYVVEDRGFEISRRQTTDIDELLRWIFEAISFNMAVQYELVNRDKGRDSRRKIFEKQLEILSILSSSWSSIRRSSINDILDKYPFIDS